MAYNFTNTPPDWQNEGTEPTDDIKSRGFESGYKPPAAIFNWFWTKVSKCIKELQTVLKEVHSLTTQNTSDIDTVEETLREEFQETTGNLSDLATFNKDNLVEAINENTNDITSVNNVVTNVEEDLAETKTNNEDAHKIMNAETAALSTTVGDITQIYDYIEGDSVVTAANRQFSETWGVIGDVGHFTELGYGDTISDVLNGLDMGKVDHSFVANLQSQITNNTTNIQNNATNIKNERTERIDADGELQEQINTINNNLAFEAQHIQLDSSANINNLSAGCYRITGNTANAPFTGTGILVQFNKGVIPLQIAMHDMGYGSFYFRHFVDNEWSKWYKNVANAVECGSIPLKLSVNANGGLSATYDDGN